MDDTTAPKTTNEKSIDEDSSDSDDNFENDDKDDGDHGVKDSADNQVFYPHFLIFK